MFSTGSFRKTIENLARLVYYIPYYVYLYIRAVNNMVLKYFTRTPKDLNGDIILVTGAASGIGQQLVLTLAKRFPKATYVLWDINETGLRDTKKACLKTENIKIFTYTINLEDKDQISQTAQLVRKDVGIVSVLINNAGLAYYGKFLEANAAAEEKVFRVNTLSYMWITREFLPDMILAGTGHLVSISSVVALSRFTHLSSYNASKYALQGFLETLKLELRQHPSKPKVTVTTVYPGFVKTPMAGEFYSWKPRYDLPGLVPMDPKYVAKKIMQAIVLKRERLVVPQISELMDIFYR